MMQRSPFSPRRQHLYFLVIVQINSCNVGTPFTVFHLGFRRGMAPSIIGGTLPYMPGTRLTGVGISITHPPQLRVQTESVKQVNIASY